MVNECVHRVVCLKPSLPSISEPFVEGHVNDLHVLTIHELKVDFVLQQAREILLCLSRCGRTETFVVLGLVVFGVCLLAHPHLILRYREESFDAVLTVEDFDNWCDKLD